MSRRGDLPRAASSARSSSTICSRPAAGPTVAVYCSCRALQFGKACFLRKVSARHPILKGDRCAWGHCGSSRAPAAAGYQRQDVPLPSGPPPKRQTDLAAATFVPALAEINDQSATIRHIAGAAAHSDHCQPVINVSWDDAEVYVAWLSRLTRENRLLSEAEFEYAARAGSTTRFPWGDEVGENNANCDGSKSQTEW